MPSRIWSTAILWAPLSVRAVLVSVRPNVPARASDATSSVYRPRVPAMGPISAVPESVTLTLWGEVVSVTASLRSLVLLPYAAVSSIP